MDFFHIFIYTFLGGQREKELKNKKKGKVTDILGNIFVLSYIKVQYIEAYLYLTWH